MKGDGSVARFGLARPDLTWISRGSWHELALLCLALPFFMSSFPPRGLAGMEQDGMEWAWLDRAWLGWGRM